MDATLTRRRFLAGAAALGMGATAARFVLPDAARSALPLPPASGLDHVVVLTMENRSFDHLLGWLRGADGRQAGLAYPDRDGVLHATHHLAEFQGCGFSDPDHSYEGARAEYNE